MHSASQWLWTPAGLWDRRRQNETLVFMSNHQSGIVYKWHDNTEGHLMIAPPLQDVKAGMEDAATADWVSLFVMTQHGCYSGYSWQKLTNCLALLEILEYWKVEGIQVKTFRASDTPPSLALIMKGNLVAALQTSLGSYLHLHPEPKRLSASTLHDSEHKQQWPFITNITAESLHMAQV